MDVGTTTAVVGTGIAVIGAMVPVLRVLRRLSRQMGQLQEDWYGQPARPGFRAIPGVPERLETIETQLKPNGGSSMRDAITRIELNQSRLGIDQGILARRLDAHLDQIGPAVAELTEWQKSRNVIEPDER